MNLARLNSGRWVTSVPPIEMVPASTGKVPATAFSMVDLPAPLPPMTVQKSPSFSVRLTPRRACFSLTVPALKVFQISLISSIGGHLLGGLDTGADILVLPEGDGQEDGHHHGAEELQVVGVQAHSQHRLDNNVVDNGADGDAEQLQTEVAEQLGESHLADDDGGQADDDGAAAHVDLAGAVVLGQQSAGQGHQAVGDHQAQHLAEVGVDA